MSDKDWQKNAEELRRKLESKGGFEPDEATADIKKGTEIHKSRGRIVEQYKDGNWKPKNPPKKKAQRN